MTVMVSGSTVDRYLFCKGRWCLLTAKNVNNCTVLSVIEHRRLETIQPLFENTRSTGADDA